MPMKSKIILAADRAQQGDKTSSNLNNAAHPQHFIVIIAMR